MKDEACQININPRKKKWLTKRNRKYGVNFFYKKTGLGVIVTSKAGAKINNELAQELQINSILFKKISR